MGETQLRPDRQILRPRTLFKQWLERFSKGCQDAQGWLRMGIMDQIYPMMYFKGNQFYPFALDWNENCHGRTIVPGLGIYFLSSEEGNWPVDEVIRQMYVARKRVWDTHSSEINSSVTTQKDFILLPRITSIYIRH